ncbi:MAG: cytochrome b/b6 domain-containing protein [Desulfomonilaceae bacterium]
MHILSAPFLFLLRLFVISFVAITSLQGTAQALFPSDDECLECHAHPDLTSRKGSNLFVDPVKFKQSVHAENGIACTSCHDSISFINKNKAIPHEIGIEPKCGKCHPKVNQQYSKSLHAQISKKICYSCHNPHYSVPFHQLSSEDRKIRCLNCHDAYSTHRWLPQRQLHFDYLECATCHDLNAEIGAVFHIVETNRPPGESILNYGKLAPFVEPGKGLVETLDQDGNGRLSPAEISSFLERLRKNGIPEASLDVRILVLRPTHNFTDKGEQTRDCSLCHSENARFYSKLVLEVPEKGGDFRTIPVDRQIFLLHGPGGVSQDFYLLGESKIRRKDLSDILEMFRQIGFKWIDLVGVLLILSSLAAVSFHALLMFFTRKLREGGSIEAHEHPLTETVGHMIHGLCVILLLLTGLQLRLPDLLPIFATFLNAVNLHNICAAVVIVDYVFWIAYEVWSGRLKSRYLVFRRGFFRNSIEMLNYYGYLIFVHENCPRNFDSASVLESLEKFLFFAMMFLLIPGQILTGILLYDLYRTMPVIEKLGGIRVIDGLHLTCAYLLMSALVIHTYFHTLKKYGGKPSF